MPTSPPACVKVRPSKTGTASSTTASTAVTPASFAQPQQTRTLSQVIRRNTMAGEEEEYDARVAEIIKNFNDSDDGEDSWEAGHFQDVDDLDEQVYGSIEQAGEAFFITALKLFLQTDVAPGKQFHCSPREKDNAPGDVPLMHPIRAIVKVMDAAPDNSIIRMYIYSIDDPYVIDTMVHCAKSKYIRVILHPSQKSIEKIAQFCRNFSRGPDGTSPRHLVETSMEFRAFKLDGERCNEYTSMHEKKIITPDLTVVGSYDLTYQARVWNSESIYCIATTDQDTRRFDEEWASLSERVIRIFNPNPMGYTLSESDIEKNVAEFKKEASAQWVREFTQYCQTGKHPKLTK